MPAPTLPSLLEIDPNDLSFNVGAPTPGKGRVVFVKHKDGTDVSFYCGQWTPDLMSPNPAVRIPAMKNLPHVRSHFHRKREKVENINGVETTKTLDSQTIDVQLTDAEIVHLDKIRARYIEEVFKRQSEIWTKASKPATMDEISQRMGALAKPSSDGTGMTYAHFKVHYPTFAGTDKPNPRATNTILQQDPRDLESMYNATIESIQRNQPGILTATLRGMCVVQNLIHPTMDLQMFGGCAFDPNAGVRDTSIFTNLGMKIASTPAPSLVAMDSGTFVGVAANDEEEELPMDVTSNNF